VQELRKPLLGFSLEAAAKKAGARLPHSKMRAEGKFFRGLGETPITPLRQSPRFGRVHDFFALSTALHHQAVGSPASGHPLFTFIPMGITEFPFWMNSSAANDLPVKNTCLLVDRLENAVGPMPTNRRGSAGGQQRLIDFSVQNYVVRMLEAIAA